MLEIMVDGEQSQCSWFKGHWVDLLALMIAAWALFYSCRSNNIADNAIEVSKQIARADKRPQLTVRPIKTNGTFYECRMSDKGVALVFKLELENRGSSPAHNISLPVGCTFMSTETTNQAPLRLKYMPPPIVSIAQGDKSYMVAKVKLEMPDKSAKQCLNDFAKGRGVLGLELAVEYTDLLSPPTSYCTTVGYEMRRGECRILREQFK